MRRGMKFLSTQEYSHHAPSGRQEPAEKALLLARLLPRESSHTPEHPASRALRRSTDRRSPAQARSLTSLIQFSKKNQTEPNVGRQSGPRSRSDLPSG